MSAVMHLLIIGIASNLPIAVVAFVFTFVASGGGAFAGHLDRTRKMVAGFSLAWYCQAEWGGRNDRQRLHAGRGSWGS